MLGSRVEVLCAFGDRKHEGVGHRLQVPREVADAGVMSHVAARLQVVYGERIFVVRSIHSAILRTVCKVELVKASIRL